MKNVTIEGTKNETYNVIGVENTDHLPAMQAHLKSRNFDGKIYTLSRNIEGTRKAQQTVQCYKAINHDTFISMI